MESSQQKPRRIFTPQQKFEIIKDIERYPTIREGLAKHGITSGLFCQWKRQLVVGIKMFIAKTTGKRKLAELIGKVLKK